MTDCRITGLRTDHRHDPLGIPIHAPFFRWEVEGCAAVESFEVRVGDSPQHLVSGDRWSTTTREPRAVYAGSTLTSRSRKYWMVLGLLSDGGVVESPVAEFETGLGPNDWTASWIAAPLLPFRRETWDPPVLIRKSVNLDEVPERVLVYATALGPYRLWINGTEITASALLRPGWTDYSVRVYHQTFDVTAHLVPGENVVAVALAKGWYAGRLGLQREPGFYGDQPSFRLQIEADHSRVVVATDSTWRYAYGAVLSADLLQGEQQDVRLEPEGWRESRFDDAAWAPVTIVERSVRVDPQPHDSPSVLDTREGRLVWEHARGPAVYDFGQNLVGWTRLETRTLPRADLIVRHGEILTPHNLVYRDNLRTAFQEDRYSTGDDAHHVLEPQFTLHGFRYAEVWGLPSRASDGPLEVLEDTKISAVVVDAGMTKIGHFECSDVRLNALSKAIEWTIRDNFIEVITDCPQRDERLGWLGDAGVIGRTSAYYFDVAAFVRKFVQDAADAQAPDGTLRSYVPPVPPGTHIAGAPGWADGYVRLVHLLGSRYGDVEAVRRHYEALKRYMDRVDADNPSGIRTEGVGSDFGDWLSLPEDPDEPPHPLYGYTGARSTSPRPIVATAHTFRSYLQLAEMAEWLGNTLEQARCLERAEFIRRAYVDRFFSQGRLEGDTQTVYAQALGYGLLEGDLAEAAARRLAEKVEETGHVTTGIHGTEHLLPVLTRFGRADLAYRLLLREEMPGWLHMIAKGATTIWEKWDGLTADGTLSTAEMNSFNHCALGAVGQFLFEGVGGLDLSVIGRDSHITVSPTYNPSLEWVNVSSHSAVGRVSSRWRWQDGEIAQEIDLPALSTGRFIVPLGFELSVGDTELKAGRKALTLMPTRR